jgi:hypothetical protein
MLNTKLLGRSSAPMTGSSLRHRHESMRYHDFGQFFPARRYGRNDLCAQRRDTHEGQQLPPDCNLKDTVGELN